MTAGGAELGAGVDVVVAGSRIERAADEAVPAIAIALPGLDESAQRVLEAMTERLRERGYRAVVHNARGTGRGREGDAAVEALSNVLAPALGPVLARRGQDADRAGVAGLIAVAGADGRPPTAMPMNWERLPVVTVGARGPGHDCVVVDIDDAAQALLAHLGAQTSLQRVAVVGRDPQYSPHVAALVRAVTERRIELHPDSSAHGCGRVAGYRAAMRLNREQGDVDAVLAGDDETALGVLDAFAELGVEIPGGVLVAGFGDLGAGRSASPTLTTVDLRTAEQGRMAADLLVDRLSGSRRDEPRVHSLNARVVVRRSTRGPDPALRLLPGRTQRRTPADAPDAVSAVESVAGPAPASLDRRWVSHWLDSFAQQVRRGSLDGEWVRSWARPVGDVDVVEQATDWLMAGCRVVMDAVRPGLHPDAAAAASAVHDLVMRRLARAVSERAWAQERALARQVRQTLALTAAVSAAASAEEAVSALVAELPHLSVSRLMLLRVTAGPRAEVALAYEEGSIVLDPAGSDFSFAGVRDGSPAWRGAPVLLCPLVVGRSVTGLLAYETHRPGSTDEALPLGEEFVHSLAQAFGRDLLGSWVSQTQEAIAAAEADLIAERSRAEHLEEELRRASRELTRSLTVDPLTGIHNRSSLDEVLEREWRGHVESMRPLALLMVDIDHFKAYNDKYGHVQGDATLREVASRLRAAARRTGDVAARYGGEEFALVLPDTDVLGAERVAEEVLNGVRRADIRHAGSPDGRIAVSIGVAVTVPRPEISVGDFVRAADRALYRAKNGGRDQRFTADDSAWDGRDQVESSPGLPAGN